MPADINKRLFERQNSSVCTRRGHEIPKIDIEQHASKDSCHGTPKIINDLLQFIITPSPKKFKSSCCYRNRNASSIALSPKSNSCALLSPLILEKDDFSNFLNDITLEEIVKSPESKISDVFLSNLASRRSSTKLTLFTPSNSDDLFSTNFFNNMNLHPDDVTLVVPKSRELITPRTPVVVKRKLGGKDEFNIYFPPEYTSDLVNNFWQFDHGLTMFPFPPSNDHTFQNNTDDNSYFFDGHRKKDITSSSKEFKNTSFELNPQKRSLNSPSYGRSTYRDLHFENFNSVQKTGNKKQKSTNVEVQEIRTRDFHNKLERQRRGEQFMRFQRLRAVIPNLMLKPKAAKITILRAAMMCIRQLHQDDLILQQTKLLERNRNDYLLQHLCALTGPMR